MLALFAAVQAHAFPQRLPFSLLCPTHILLPIEELQASHPKQK